MTFTIDQACLADILEISELITLSAQRLNLQDYSKTQIEAALVWVYGVDTRLIEDGTYYVVRLKGKMVGCGGWSRRQKNFGGDQTEIGSQDFLDPRVDAAKIRAFFVHPDHARQGIGTALLNVCEQKARAARFTKAELTATLTGAHLYGVKGYEVLERYNVDVPGHGAFPVMRMQKILPA